MMSDYIFEYPINNIPEHMFFMEGDTIIFSGKSQEEETTVELYNGSKNISSSGQQNWKLRWNVASDSEINHLSIRQKVRNLPQERILSITAHVFKVAAVSIESLPTSNHNITLNYSIKSEIDAKPDKIRLSIAKSKIENNIINGKFSFDIYKILPGTHDLTGRIILQGNAGAVGFTAIKCKIPHLIRIDCSINDKNINISENNNIKDVTIEINKSDVLKALPNSEGTPFVLHNNVKSIINTDKNGNITYSSDEIIQGKHNIIVEYKLNDGNIIFSNEINFHIIRNMKLDFERIISQIGQPSVQRIDKYTTTQINRGNANFLINICKDYSKDFSIYTSKTTNPNKIKSLPEEIKSKAIEIIALRIQGFNRMIRFLNSEISYLKFIDKNKQIPEELLNTSIRFRNLSDTPLLQLQKDLQELSSQEQQIIADIAFE